MGSRMIQRLSQRIKERAAHVILFELKDPRMGFVTVTTVKLAEDLATCKVFYSVMGTPGEISRTRHAVESARGYIQRRVGEGLRTRVTPQLEMCFDESVEGAARMGSLLRQISEERAKSETGDDPVVGEDPA